MKVKDLLRSKKPPVTIAQHSTIDKAMKLLIEHKIGSLIVVDETGHPVGIITERDIFHLAFRYRGDVMDMTVKDIMSGNLIMGKPGDDLDLIAELIAHNHIRHVPIMDDGRLIGIVSIRDIMHARAKGLAGNPLEA